MSITVEPLHPALGARVTGIDFRAPLDTTTVDAVMAAWMEHLVLVFPDQPLTDQQHAEVSHYFGVPEVFHQGILKSTTVPEIFRVSNTDEDGNLMPPDHPTMQQISSARQWHTDSSYRQHPAIGSLLHGIRTSKTGGLTCFINMYAVYEALPPELKRQVENKRARHDFEHLSRLTGATPPTPEERAAMPPVWQPLVRRHPVTGRKSLYISPIYNDEIEGMESEAAVELVAALTAFAEQDRFVFKHKWTDHDIVMWDNRCTMHLVTPHDPTEKRIMHRTTIAGTHAVEAA